MVPQPEPWVLPEGPGPPHPALRLRSARSALHLAATLERPAEGQFVRVFEVAAHRQTTGDPGDREPHGLQEAGQVHGRGLTLEVGIVQRITSLMPSSSTLTS